MCRLMAYMGRPVLVADVVLWPDRSIIKQSYDARERKSDAGLPSHLSHGNLNGDGFGIGWFSQPQDGVSRDPTPCVFTSVTPAWNNENLGRLSCKITSPLVFAHVRAAYPGMPVSEQNCHPFQWGRYLWMHNGVVGGFMQIRRTLLATLSNAAYDTVQSFHSDSAVCFALFLHHLRDLTAPLSPHELLQAMEATFATITKAQQEAGITEVSLLNFVVSDGATMIATRYVSHEDEQPASLYYAEGSGFQRQASPGGGCGGVTNASTARRTSVACEAEYTITYGELGTRCAIVASEPITKTASDWVAVPRNTALVICHEKAEFINIVRAPIGPTSPLQGCQEEVKRCLEAISGAAAVAGRPWVHHHKRQRQNSLDESALQLQPTQSIALSTAESSGSGSNPAAGGRGGCSSPRVVPAEEHQLTGHSGAVLCLLVHRGRTLFSGSSDCTIKVWDLEQCKCVRTLAGHSKPVHRLELAGSLLFSAAGNKVRVWSLATFACVHVLQTAHSAGGLSALAAAPSGRLYVAGQDSHVHMLRNALLSPVDSDHQLEQRAANGHAASHTGHAASQNGSSHAASQNGRTAHAHEGKAIGHSTLVELADEAAQRLSMEASTSGAAGHCGAVHALALCAGYVCSAGSDAMIRVWQTDSLKLHRILRGHRGSVLTLFSLGNLLLSGGRDNIIRVWDMDALVCRRTLSGHKDDVTSISGLHLLSLPFPSPESTTTLDAIDTIPSTLESIPSGFDHMEVDDAAALFASASADATVRLWSAKCWSCVRIFAPSAGTALGPVLPQPAQPFLACAMSDKYTVTGASDGVVRLWASEDVARRALEAALGIGHTPCAALDDSAQSAVAVRNGGSPQPRRRVKRVRTEGGAVGAPRLERELERALREFVRLRTVSLDPELHEECFRGAKFLAHLLEGLGAEIKLVRPSEQCNPVVIGRLGRDVARPTVTFYGHYDVQPAMERDWRTDPFEMVAVDGYFYGRGTSDNKGPILAFIYAVKEMLAEGRASGGALPVNVAFVFEGEEENGSSGFREAVTSNLHWFEGTQLIVISNTLWVGERVPCLTYGMRGMISASIEVCGPARDLHSGNDGGVFNEPLSDLTKVLASLVDSRNNIMVPGFYEGVRAGTLAAALPGLEASEEFSLAGYQAALGLPRLAKAATKRDLLTARWCEPTLSVVDVRVGDEGAPAGTDASYRFGPTRFSVIPRSATGNISIRFVPDQRAQHLVDCLRAHVEHEFGKLRSSNSIALRVKSVGDWWEADPASRLFRLAQRALARQWAQPPLLVREGGTMPVASALEKMLGAPALLIPFGQSSDACHLANERLQRINLLAGKNVIKHLLEEMAAPEGTADLTSPAEPVTAAVLPAPHANGSCACAR